MGFRPYPVRRRYGHIKISNVSFQRMISAKDAQGLHYVLKIPLKHMRVAEHTAEERLVATLVNKVLAMCDPSGIYARPHVKRVIGVVPTLKNIVYNASHAVVEEEQSGSTLDKFLSELKHQHRASFKFNVEANTIITIAVLDVLLEYGDRYEGNLVVDMRFGGRPKAKA